MQCLASSPRQVHQHDPSNSRPQRMSTTPTTKRSTEQECRSGVSASTLYVGVISNILGNDALIEATSMYCLSSSSYWVVAQRRRIDRDWCIWNSRRCHDWMSVPDCGSSFRLHFLKCLHTLRNVGFACACMLLLPLLGSWDLNVLVARRCSV